VSPGTKAAYIQYPIRPGFAHQGGSNQIAWMGVLAEFVEASSFTYERTNRIRPRAGEEGDGGREFSAREEACRRQASHGFP